MNPVTRIHSYDPVRWKETHHPEHFWSATYTGHDFHRELIKTYYRTSTFIFGDDTDLIARFLETNSFQTGYPPADLVSKIEVHLNAVTFDRTSCIGYMFGCSTKPETLVAALDGAEGLKEGASVVVRFWTQAKDEEQRDEQVRVACEVLVPRLWELREKGFRVRVVIDGREEIKLGGDSNDRWLK